MSKMQKRTPRIDLTDAELLVLRAIEELDEAKLREIKLGDIERRAAEILTRRQLSPSLH